MSRHFSALAFEEQKSIVMHMLVKLQDSNPVFEKLYMTVSSFPLLTANDLTEIYTNIIHLSESLHTLDKAALSSNNA